MRFIQTSQLHKERIPREFEAADANDQQQNRSRKLVDAILLQPVEAYDGDRAQVVAEKLGAIDINCGRLIQHHGIHVEELKDIHAFLVADQL